MTDYAVTGKKGSGKGLFCAGLIRDALRAGKKVATNMDISLAEMLPVTSRATLYRLPDCPTVDDLLGIGKGNEIIDDDLNGIIVLDEASKFFNARAWGDKARQPLLDWLIHSRKLGWDVYYQMQGLEQVDKQLRTTQIEYHIAVKNTKMWPIPLVTPLLGLFGMNVRFPRMNIGIIKQGCDRDSLIVGRKFFRSKELFTSYDTRQVFMDRENPGCCGLHSLLSPWHTVGRHRGPIPPYWLRFVRALFGRDVFPDVRALDLIQKKPLILALRRLDPDVALKHWRRLDELGYWSKTSA